MTAMDAIADPLDVLIVGAGISGIGMAAHLQEKCPGRSFTIIERRLALGGTWDLFRYPGIRSDSDMYTLGFAFEPWRGERAIAGGKSIRDYLERVVDDRAIRSHIRFGQTVAAADWDSAAGLWTLQMTDAGGKSSTLTARFLYLGSGYYDYDSPHDAQIPGIETFAGAVIHPQFWPEGFDYGGKRVVVIGSGATAVTLVPAMAEHAGHVTMLQRTPSWMFAMPARDALARALRRVLPERWAYRLTRAKNVTLQSMMFRRARTRPRAVAAYLTRQLKAALGDAYDRRAFTPPYNPWEQRLCLVPDGDLFEAIKAGQAAIVTGTIAAVEADGILLADGRRIAADVIVTATGLRLAFGGKIAIRQDGKRVDFAQRYFYRNAMFSNLPNFAALFGYLNAGWTLRVDVVADWLCRLFHHMDAKGVNVVTPVLPENHGLVVDPVFDMFSSGYIRRGRDLAPKSSTTAPWQLHMHYREDRRELRAAPIEDGVLRFERVATTSAHPELVERSC